MKAIQIKFLAALLLLMSLIAPALAQDVIKKLPDPSVFGIRLGEPLHLPVCEREKFSGISSAPTNGGCSENPAAVGSASASFTGVTRLLYWALVLPVYVAGTLEVDLVEGKVESVRVHTRGLGLAPVISADLAKKLGPPHLTLNLKMTTVVGDLEAPLTSWDFGEFRVRHESATTKTNVGLLTFTTPKGSAAYEKRMQDALKPTRGLIPL